MDARTRRKGTLVAVAIVGVFAVMVAWRLARDARRRNGPGTPASDEPRAWDADSATTTVRTRDEDSPSSRDDDVSPARATAPVARTVRGDPALHDEVRARILAAWRDGIVAARNAQVPVAAATDAAAPGTLEPEYIRSIVRDEFVPMARTCYEQQVERQPGARGRITLAFTILGDPHAGGIVDDVRLDDRDAGTWDDTFRTCMQETMRTMVFRAPTGNGRVTVRYPFALETDARDE